MINVQNNVHQLIYKALHGNSNALWGCEGKAVLNTFLTFKIIAG